ncbi:ERI1 exoribonuclease 3-like [Antedon mediterranea]|uniref:ERI1 exoribonuclease 3-like n=1 Tax=Antedon mediterranea TaxID=105859 RepID=UPI003AF838A8
MNKNVLLLCCILRRSQTVFSIIKNYDLVKFEYIFCQSYRFISSSANQPLGWPVKQRSKSYSSRPILAVKITTQGLTSNSTSSIGGVRVGLPPLVMASSQLTNSPAGGFSHQKFDYFLVLDFEATCDNETRMYPQEIIELPVLKVNGKTFETEAEFHTYVQPTSNRQLTQFCTELTGITQSMVDGKPTFQESLKMLNDWMVQQDLLSGNNSFIFVTCGDWDFRKQLTHQCEYTGVQFPHYCKQWVNIKKAFARATGTYCKGMPGMLDKLHLTLDGRHHSGIDDSRNIAKILKEIAKKGFVFERTGWLE